MNYHEWLRMPAVWDQFGVSPEEHAKRIHYRGQIQSGMSTAEKESYRKRVDYENNLTGNNLFGLKMDILSEIKKLEEVVVKIEEAQQTQSKTKFREYIEQIEKTLK